MDVDRGIRVAVDSGNVTLGSDKSVQGIKLGKGKLVIIAQNCPVDIREDVMHYSKLSDIPVYDYEGTSLELGSVCGKPFTVATLIIKDPGDSNILEIMG
ncbi:MAG: 50S ribosomal protein L30e [Methanobacterium sp.]|jgi:large subunit ribosomal protein L30e